MSATAKPPSPRILVVRLGAMGDLLHALPAVASLKRSFPACHLAWLVEPRWTPLLEGNPHVDRILLLRRQSLGGLLASWRALRQYPFDLAIDFQGLLKSAIPAWAARPREIFGFERHQLREPAAAFFYSRRVPTQSAHVVDQNLDLAAAAGATCRLHEFPLPPGQPEGELPAGDFVLASPFAGWQSKQWPIEHYQTLAVRLAEEIGMPLVLNCPPGTHVPPGRAVLHTSSLAGLIHATRRATAVVGVDSGPLHLAAALGKPGVAIFGPTDPARNGPYGGSLHVLRSPAAATTYKRDREIAESMRRIAPADVLEALKAAVHA